jgi:hypothetical protein
MLDSSPLFFYPIIPQPPQLIWRYLPDQQMSVTLPQIPVVQGKKYSDLVWGHINSVHLQLPGVGFFQKWVEK